MSILTGQIIFSIVDNTAYQYFVIMSIRRFKLHLQINIRPVMVYQLFDIEISADCFINYCLQFSKLNYYELVMKDTS